MRDHARVCTSMPLQSEARFILKFISERRRPRRSNQFLSLFRVSGGGLDAREDRFELPLRLQFLSEFSNGRAFARLSRARYIVEQ